MNKLITRTELPLQSFLENNNPALGIKRGRH